MDDWKDILKAVSAMIIFEIIKRVSDMINDTSNTGKFIMFSVKFIAYSQKFNSCVCPGSNHSLVSGMSIFYSDI